MPTVIPSDGARYFSKGFNDNHAAPALEYVWDSGVVWQPTINGQPGALSTGAWRPIIPSDLAGTSNVSVSGLSLTVGAVALTGTSVVTLTGNTPVSIVNSAPIPVSGVVQANVSVVDTGNRSVSVVNPVLATSGISTILSLPTQNVAVTGGQIQTIVTGTIGGSVTVSSVAITGAPVVTITGVLPVSTSVTVGNVTVTGFPSTIAPQAVSGFFTPIWTGAPNVTASVSIGNVAVTGGNIGVIDPTSWALLSGISGSLTSNLSSAAWVTGQVSVTNGVVPVSGIVQATAPAIQAISGNTVTQVTGFNTGIVVTTQPVTKTVTSNASPSGASPWTSMSSVQTGQILAANPARVMFFVQNIHTGQQLYVALNSNAASTGNFSFILNPSTTAGWGGSSFSDDHYRGAVCVSGGGWIHWEV